MPTLPPTFAPIIAERPYDAMGQDFQDTFGAFLDQTTLNDNPATANSQFHQIAFSLFKKRLQIAKQYNTFFAQQMVRNGHEIWRERYTGSINDPCYSFAIDKLQRTERFHRWCSLVKTPPNDKRTWDEKFAPLPQLPCGPHTPFAQMDVWSYKYTPIYAARQGGAFNVRRLAYADGAMLIEHPRGHWIPQIRQEAQAHWAFAHNPDNNTKDRFASLAAFEWCWAWANPFGRAGALTGDALSLLLQKHMHQQGLPIHVRKKYYHMDCECLLSPFEAYVNKRQQDFSHGFREAFPMEQPVSISM